MTQNGNCAACGGPLQPMSSSGVCERCLLAAGLRTGEQETRAELLRMVSSAEQAAYVREVCRDDPELRDRLLSWVADLQPEVSASENELRRPAPAAESEVGLLDGRYQLLKKIGEGGFGSVYLAIQLSPVQRRVAVKLLKLGMNSRQLVARFELERQALALMDHPNIAKVFDAGVTESGRPYFVMELVRGVPITQYCQRQQLSIPKRLDLFVTVCQAVQHAHQKGMIHRDLKPSNILVAVQEGLPVSKVIDFGIAKAMQPELADHTAFTQEHHLLGTPAYISPEQAAFGSADIDTRSDVYSLGVLLYELLTGSTPFDTKELAQAGLDEMRRIIREREPARPSTRVSQNGADQHRSDSGRSETQCSKTKIDRDLDWIVLKCLRKDRTLRYATANGLATDVQRYLTHEPIIARPPSSLYRVRKAIRRHRLPMLAGAAALAALVCGTVVSTWQAIRATRAEHEQVRLRREVEAELNRREGEFAAKHGHWQEAVPFYQKTIALIPSNQEFYHHLTPLLAKLRALPLYDETCRNALARFRQTTDPRVAERMTKDCLALPDSKADPEVLTRIADVAVKMGRTNIDLPWFQLAKGLAEYRCGRNLNAVAWLEKALAGAADLATDPGRVYVQVQGRAVLALAHCRLGRTAKARTTLDEGRAIARERLPQLAIHGLNDYWPDSIYADVFLDEAADQIARP
jgi:serine/threonine protein kinase